MQESYQLQGKNILKNGKIPVIVKRNFCIMRQMQKENWSEW